MNSNRASKDWKSSCCEQERTKSLVSFIVESKRFRGLLKSTVVHSKWFFVCLTESNFLNQLA